MNKEKNKKVYVVGHKNPDTDSICSAIAYAALKTKITGHLLGDRLCGPEDKDHRDTPRTEKGRAVK